VERQKVRLSCPFCCTVGVHLVLSQERCPPNWFFFFFELLYTLVNVGLETWVAACEYFLKFVPLGTVCFDCSQPRKPVRAPLNDKWTSFHVSLAEMGGHVALKHQDEEFVN
jgi:hypothetical protein